MLLAAGCGGGSGGSPVDRSDDLADFPAPAPAARTEIAGLPAAEAVAFDSRGNLYAASLRGTIVRVSSTGERTVLAETGKGIVGLAVGPGDRLFAAAIGEGEVLTIEAEGEARVVAQGIDSPNALAFDPGGLLLVSATGLLRGEDEIVCLTPDERLVTLTTEVSTPNGIAFGDDGRLYVAETLENRIVRFAIDPDLGFSPPEVYATGIRLPDGIAFDERGNLLVAGDDAIWIVAAAPGATVLRYVTHGDVDGPTSVAFADGAGRDPTRLFFANYGYPERGSGSTVASVVLGVRGRRLLAP
jgi:gluconolactonase